VAVAAAAFAAFALWKPRWSIAPAAAAGLAADRVERSRAGESRHPRSDDEVGNPFCAYQL
jgi:hypothetical protein